MQNGEGGDCGKLDGPPVNDAEIPCRGQGELRMLQGFSRLTIPLTAAFLLCAGQSVHALETLRVAKAGLSLIFNLAEVGKHANIWQSVGLDIQTIQMDGEAPMDKAFTAADIDIALGAGTSMGYSVKGVPDIAVATLSSAPYDFVILVKPDSPIKTVADLKGKAVSVTAAGSVTWWMVHELSRRQGWGPDGTLTEPLGGLRTQFAALQRGDVAAIVTTPETGFSFEEHNQGRIIVFFGDVVKMFMTHAILASNPLVADHPDQVARFLKGWFTTVAYVRKPEHREEAVKVISEVMNLSPTAVAKALEIDIKGLSDDGAFVPEAVDMIRNSLPEFGVLDAVPPVKGLYNDSFVPVKLAQPG
jgi:ABC-type nitrate/sulfonate/bicarbonate transport system substrate-binding protein